jgi:hypothetical protein
MSTRTRGTRATLAAVVAVLLALAMNASAQAEEAVNHPFGKVLLGGLSEKKPPTSELDDPCGVAVGSADDIYVSDFQHGVIRGPSFVDQNTKKLEFPTKIKFEGDNSSCGLAIDEEGNLYVNFFHGAVVKYVPNIYPPPSPSEPPLLYATETIYTGQATGVAVDPRNGDLLVNVRDGIAVYSEPVEAGDTPNAVIGSGSLEDGYGVAISAFADTEGQIYAADAGDNTVKVFDPGVDPVNPVRTLTGAGNPQGGFVSLTDSSLATDQVDGHVFVADNLQPGFEHPAAAINEFSPAGLYRGQLERSLVHGEPVGIAVNESPSGKRGEIYVTTGNGTSIVIPPDEGTPPSELSFLLAFGPGGAGQRLSVTTSGLGDGSVVSNPAGIDCGFTCEAEFNEGKNLVLTPQPEPGSAFAGWSGACTGTGACELTLEAAESVNAEFVDAPALLGPAPAAAAGAVTRATTSPPSSGSALTTGRARAGGAGTVLLSVVTADAGTISAGGKRLRRSTLGVEGPGPISVPLRLNRAGRKALANSPRGHLWLRATLTFDPADGATSTVDRTVNFKQASRGIR